MPYEEFSNLKVVAKLGTGLDNIDLDACRQAKVHVLSAPAMNSISTAEFTVTQILNIYKNSFRIYDGVKEHDFRRVAYYGRELSELRIGIIGYGSVGRNIAKRIQPFVAKILVRDRNEARDTQKDNIHFVTDLNTLLAESDAIILAVSLKNNEKMVNKNFLAKVKPDAVIANIARGGLVDEPALIEFLRKHPQAFYYCDVLEKEPDYTLSPEAQNYHDPLFALPNFLFTPHIAGMTKECQKKIAIDIAQKIIKSVEAHKSKKEPAPCLPKK